MTNFWDKAYIFWVLCQFSCIIGCLLPAYTFQPKISNITSGDKLTTRVYKTKDIKHNSNYHLWKDSRGLKISVWAIRNSETLVNLSHDTGAFGKGVLCKRFVGIVYQVSIYIHGWCRKQPN